MKIKDPHILYDDADITKAARCLKAMSHPLRLKILCLLGNKSISVQEIVEQVGTSQSNISQHLSILKEKNILDKTIIIFTADHGDSLGEEGRFGHAYTIYPEVMRIPLLIHLPKSLFDNFSFNKDRLTFLTDIAPSLYELFNYKVTLKNSLFGRSIFWKKESPPIEREPGPYLFASSYGPVYGLLSEDTSHLFISDGINFTDQNYLIENSGSRQEPVDRSTINDNHDVIKRKILELSEYYEYDDK